MGLANDVLASKMLVAAQPAPLARAVAGAVG